MELLLYKLVTFSLLVTCCYSRQIYGRCTFDCEELPCECNVYCPPDAVQLPYEDLRDYDLSYCTDIHRDYNGRTSKGVNFIIRRNSPLYSNNEPNNIILDDHEAYMVYSIDISYNEYNVFPISVNMQHLQKMNMSKNSLMEVKLSNVHEFAALSEIDFSYNSINTIEVNSLEYPFKELTILNLSHNYLVSIPDAIFSVCPKLKSLDLSHNFIDRLTVLTFEGVKNLVYLYLSYNRIMKIDNSLLRFNYLEELDLSHNLIENIKSDDFDKLICLKKLDLSSNSLLVIERNIFKNMPLLKIIDLSVNKVESIDKETFWNASSLESINLSRNNIREMPKDLFKGKTLSSFTIQENRLEGSLIKGTFEGLKFVTEIDLSGQQLTSIEDYAFFGLEKITTLLLNNNYIREISKDAFRNLQKLEVLDLSNNKLSNIDFEKKDLISLYSLLLQNNNLTQVKPEFFFGLNMLQFLDLSNNKIVQFEKDSFMSLRDLINIQISNNPVSGTLEESTFNGLNSLPTLDISRTMLTAINNGSFKGMIQLKHLNISYSKISELQFNSFLQTGSVEVIDLSFNRLQSFDVNTTDLINLNKLLLNNNLLNVITSSSLKGLPRLNELYYSHNDIKHIQNEAFLEQTDLREVDLSFNSELKFNISELANAQNLATIILSGIRSNITFKQVTDMPISHLEMAFSGINNITELKLKCFKQLDKLILNNNDIVKVEVGAFSNMSTLRILDLSYNKIEFIQPGAFKDSTLLFSLNISHNSLTTISYGIFRGLLYLNTIDISFNSISNLESERFYEVRSLSVLIVDHNKIDSVSVDDFAGISLSILSIGDNPLPCDVLVNLKKNPIPFVITAIRIDEHNDENVDGVTCNMDGSKTNVKTTSNIVGNDKVLMDIRDILHDMSAIKTTEKTLVTSNFNSDYLSNITKQIEMAGSDNNKVLLHLSNLTSGVIDHIDRSNNSTNVLLDKMLKLLTSINTVRRTPIPIPKENVTFENLLPYINKLKQDIEDTIAIEKRNILTEMDNKISSITHKKSAIFESSGPNHEALSANGTSEPKSLIFIETCVGIILLILVIFILFKFYKSGMLVPRRHSYSTRNLPEAMDNSTL